MMKIYSKKFLILSLLMIIFLSISVVSAIDNNQINETTESYSSQESYNLDNNVEIAKTSNLKNMKTDNENINSISYISPNATTDGDGSRENPINISVAFNKTNIQNKTTFTLLEGEYNLKKAISLNKSMAQNIIIQSEGNVVINGLNNINLFDIKTDNTVTIKNITFINATSTNNGAAIINAGNLTIYDSTFINNKASSGGAIYNNKGELTIINTTFKENEATGSGTSGYGGAIHTSGNVTIINSTFYNNNASKGGVLYNNKAIVNIDSNNLFENNYALWAGMIYNYQATLNIINNNTITNSTTKNYAGTLYNEKGNITISNNNKFSNNDGFTSGGVITSNLGNIIIENNNIFLNNKATYGGVINSTGNVTIKNNNLFGNNIASYAGAVIYTNKGLFDIGEKNIFENNSANYYAGSIYLWNSKANITDSIFNNNSAQEGGVLYINNNCTDLKLSQLKFNNNNATTGGVINTKVPIKLTQSEFQNNTATKGGSIYAQDNLIISYVNFTNGYAQEGGAIYTTESSTTQISKSNFVNILSENETLNLHGENLFFANTYDNSSILVKQFNIKLNNPKQSYSIGEEIKFTIQSELENPMYYDENLVENDEYKIYANDKEKNIINDSIIIDEPGTYSIYAISKVLGKTNTLENILVITNNSKPKLEVENITANYGETITLKATITGADKTVNSGKIVFKINGVTLKDDNGKIIYAKVQNNKAEINYTIPENLNKEEITIQALYSGNKNLKSLQSEKTTIIILNKTVTIEMNDIQAKTGDKIIVTAKILDNKNNIINTGKVVFKLNGKTLKESQGKIMYVNVVNGIASIEYNLENIKIRNYTISCMFISSGFERAEQNATLTVSKI